jgi:hypothetical protein
MKAPAYIADSADVTRTGALMSATKSVASTLAGIAIDRGVEGRGPRALHAHSQNLAFSTPRIESTVAARREGIRP